MDIMDDDDISIVEPFTDKALLVTSQRLRDKFVDDQGYMYTFEKYSFDYQAKFWRCDQRNYGCKVRVHTNCQTNQIIKKLHTHNHDVNAMSVEVAQVKSAVKRRAQTSWVKPSQIIDEEILSKRSIPSSAINHTSLKRTIQRNRPNTDIATTPRSLAVVDYFKSKEQSDSLNDLNKSPADPNVHASEPPGILIKLESNEDDIFQKQLNEDVMNKNKESKTIQETNKSNDDVKKSLDQKTIENSQINGCRIMKTKRMGEKFVDDDGFMFTIEKVSSNSQIKFWRCSRRSNGCKARLHTNAVTNEVIKMLNSHNHDSNALSAKVQAIQSVVKRRAVEGTDDPDKIIKDELPEMDLTAFPALKPANLRRLILRHRSVAEVTPPNPTNLADLFLPQRFQTYVTPDGSNENFLLYDSGPSSNSDRILIFGKESNLTWISKVKDGEQHISMDSTFRLPPGIFENGQMCVILLNIHGWMLPLVYSLLPSKQEHIYLSLFNILRQLMPGFNPNIIHVDYVSVACLAVKSAFPHAQLRGSPYHFSKNMHRYLSSVPNVIKRYRTEAQYALKCKAVAAMAYVPLDQMQEALNTLQTHLFPDLKFLFSWLQDIFIGGNSEGILPLFPPSVWNVNKDILNNLNYPGYLVEVSFRKLKSELGWDHPSLWRLIDNLKKVQRGVDVDYESMSSGSSPPSKRKRLHNADVKIIKLLRRFSNIDYCSPPMKMWELLQSIACNIEIEP